MAVDSFSTYDEFHQKKNHMVHRWPCVSGTQQQQCVYLLSGNNDRAEHGAEDVVRADCFWRSVFSGSSGSVVNGKRRTGSARQGDQNGNDVRPCEQQYAARGWDGQRRDARNDDVRNGWSGEVGGESKDSQGGLIDERNGCVNTDGRMTAGHLITVMMWELSREIERLIRLIDCYQSSNHDRPTANVPGRARVENHPFR